jgi:signal transduction histidine kinase
MKIRSLRAQLALWHAGLLALTLISLAALTYLILLRVLHSRADAALEEYAEVTTKLIAVQLYRESVFGGAEAGEPRSSSPRRRRFLGNDAQSWGRYIQVVTPRGQPVDWSDALNSHKLPTTAHALGRGMRGLTTFETFAHLGEHPVRVATVPVQMGRQVRYLVQTGTSLEGVEGALRRASAILLILTPSVFLVALLGGWSLVSRALRPVDEITRTAIELESRSLDRRIVPPRPDDEIGRLAGAFNEMIARLGQSFRQIEQFSADASHELRTPLTTIRGEAEVALMEELSPAEYRRVLRSIVEEVERMSAVVENLLTLARADADRVRLRRERVALDELLIAVYEQTERAARAKGVALELEAIEDLAVTGDRLWLQQLLTNLVTNAVKYTPAGGEVRLALVREAGSPHDPRPGTESSADTPVAARGAPSEWAVLAVADTGIGIPEEHQPHIFDRFYRVDAGRSRDSGGAGLGLSIARWIAEAHGGTIALTSRAGHGSTFTVRLPLAAPIEAEANPSTTVPPVGETASGPANLNSF